MGGVGFNHDKSRVIGYCRYFLSENVYIIRLYVKHRNVFLNTKYDFDLQICKFIPFIINGNPGTISSKEGRVKKGEENKG